MWTVGRTNSLMGWRQVAPEKCGRLLMNHVERGRDGHKAARHELMSGVLDGDKRHGEPGLSIRVGHPLRLVEGDVDVIQAMDQEEWRVARGDIAHRTGPGVFRSLVGDRRPNQFHEEWHGGGWEGRGQIR